MVAKAKSVSTLALGALNDFGGGGAGQAAGRNWSSRRSNLTPLSLFNSARHRKKTLLALFVTVATIGLVAALVVAFKPDTSKAVAGKSEVRAKHRVVMHFRCIKIRSDSLHEISCRYVYF